jgi:hypothetical protein
MKMKKHDKKMIKEMINAMIIKMIKNEKYFKDFQCVAGSLFHRYRVRKIWT